MSIIDPIPGFHGREGVADNAGNHRQPKGPLPHAAILRPAPALASSRSALTDHPTVEQIAAARARLGDLIIETPVHHWRGPEIAAAAGADTQAVLKLELFQYTGSFKPRGALTNMLSLPKDALARGVTAVSA